ncbi:SGNH/GDSL hydrolase family protein [Pedobacter heparinus]|uniref:SGNH/GDSL hydrolase family protein n=1 Tax=Pedobacter heparinus TaxID=984 RepID=UPI00292EA603|nr:SGNH/GDSL hydrolase family protein [Pedobacter heparinus]
MNVFKISFAGLKLSLVACFVVFSTCLYAQAPKPERFEKEVKNFDRLDSLEQVRPGSNLFVGSSSVRLWKDIADYFPGAYVINRAFGGSTFADLLHYADRAIVPYQPAKIFIYEGDNDISFGVPTDTIFKQARTLRKKIAAAFPDVPVVFISAKPSISKWHLKDKYIELNKMLKKYASKEKLTAFADVWTPMLDKDGVVFQDIFLKDNLHMKAKGYLIWQKVLEPYLLKK